MIVNVHYRRTFLSGNLRGIRVYDKFRCDVKLAPKVGSETTGRVVCGSGTYHDFVIGITPFEADAR